MGQKYHCVCGRYESEDETLQGHDCYEGQRLREWWRQYRARQAAEKLAEERRECQWCGEVVGTQQHACRGYKAGEPNPGANPAYVALQQQVQQEVAATVAAELAKQRAAAEEAAKEDKP
jgi:hypothetical protein